MRRRSGLGAGLLALLTAALAWPSAAQVPAPAGLTLVVPFAPGGPTDAMARSLATALTVELGQPVTVENRAGAGGNVGAEAVARAAPDGRTLLLGTSGPLAINVNVYRQLGYDPVRSFAPVIRIGHLPNVLVLHPSVPARSVPELLAYARTHPGELSYASSGNGASSHLAGVLFNQLTGADLFHLPYKGTGPALEDLLAGRVAMTFTDVMTALPHVKSGRLQALGVTTLARSPALPGVPSVAEQGVPGFDVSVFFAVMAPAGTPPATIERLNQAFAAVLQQAPLRAGLQGQGLVFAEDTRPQALAEFQRAELAKWRTVAQRAGVQSD